MSNLNWRRLGLLSIAGLILLLPIWGVLAWAVTPIFASLSAANEDAELARRLTLLAAEKPAYQTELTRVKTLATSQGVLYNGGSAELASAELQNNVQSLVSQNGGQLSSSAIDAPQTDHGLQILSVSLVFSLPQDHLPALLAGIDMQKPYLMVKSLDIRSTDNGGGEGPLDVNMQVSGFGASP